MRILCERRKNIEKCCINKLFFLQKYEYPKNLSTYLPKIKSFFTTFATGFLNTHFRLWKINTSP